MIGHQPEAGSRNRSGYQNPTQRGEVMQSPGRDEEERDNEACAEMGEDEDGNTNGLRLRKK